MTDELEEQELSARLSRLGAGVPVPQGDPQQDLARGRRSRRRHYAGAALGGIAAVAVIGVGASVLGAGPSIGPEVGGFAASGTPSALPTETPSRAPEPGPGTMTPTPLAEGEEKPSREWLNGGQGPVVPDPAHEDPRCAPRSTAARMSDYRDILAEHLDPEGEHLDRRVTNQQGGGGPKGCSLGTKLGWQNPGQPGMAMIELEIAVGHSPDMSAGHGDWQVEKSSLPGVKRVRTAGAGSDVAVSVTHDDGTVVTLSTAALFGNNSTVPLDGFALDTDELVRTAADPGFVTP